METKSMSMVVPEVLLNDYNYLDWSVRIRTYLMAQDLWKIVAATDDEPPKQKDEAWNTKNFMALHVIKNGCGPEPLYLIRNIDSAKTAWDVLATKYKIQPPEVVLEILEGQDNYLDWSARVRNYLMAMDVWDTIEILKEPTKKEVDGAAFKAWRKKDLLALHVIQNACGTLAFHKIRNKNSAKDAWRLLAAVFGPKPKYTGVRELLDQKNYGSWNVRVRTYLELQDLWDVKDPFNDAKALDVIKKSCGPTMKSVIEECDSAKDAWKKLSEADMALDLLSHSPSPWFLIKPDIYGNSPLSALASQPSISFSRSRLLFWERWIYALLGLLHRIFPNLPKLLGMKHIYELRDRHVQALKFQCLLHEVVANLNFSGFGEGFFEKVFLKAIKAGNHELIKNILRKDPSLQLLIDSKSRSLFSYAILYRQPRIFSLIYELEAKYELINMPDKFGNTSLHMVGMLELATDQIERIPGAAMEMKRELQWFKEIESMSSPFTKEMKNDLGETAQEMFTKNHKNMKNDGEKWMKETASSSSVVGALIITITFAATITIPGGNNGDTGFPVFSNKPIFLVFVIFNALSLLSSITAVLIFLVLLTTSYAEEDFLILLPQKMMIGMSTLSFSIATMIIAFCAALFIILPCQLWITTPVIFLSLIPVFLFLSYKFPNLIDMTKSPNGPHMFDRELKWRPSERMPYPTIVEASHANVIMDMDNILQEFT